MNLQELKKASAKQIASEFQVTLNAGEAIVNYLVWLGWGESIQVAADAASDFIETSEDVDGMEKVLKQVIY